MTAHAEVRTYQWTRITVADEVISVKIGEMCCESGIEVHSND